MVTPIPILGKANMVAVMKIAPATPPPNKDTMEADFAPPHETGSFEKSMYDSIVSAPTTKHINEE
jgi:hypothetical protein